MSTRYTNDELREMARDGNSNAVELLEARGVIPEDSMEERYGATKQELRQ
jgi:hypothetical protein